MLDFGRYYNSRLAASGKCLYSICMEGLFAEAELEAGQPQKAYTVLARKYRPSNLDGLIGQEALVRTLRNAIKTGRIAHAYLLTGIRGVGKTTTARIMARVLNNIPDDQSVDSHIDVIEMDAASHTGVDNIREIIEEAKYKPLSAPYKIYIIDEVHMLSKGAFNALLKTLEEPPAHVKFIFATTEIRKVPITILSRCQRFDLRRVEADVLTEHLKNIAAQEQLEVEEEALALIAGVAEGSVRDSLSLFDQAIAYSEGAITAAKVQEMLGFADKSQIINIFQLLLEGRISECLDAFTQVAATSAEPLQIFTDLLEFCHLVTRVKITPDLKPSHVSEGEIEAARSLSGSLNLPILTRVWQMLLKAQGEIKFSSNPKQTAEMALIRVAYSTELPDPNDLIRDLKKNSLVNKSWGPEPLAPRPSAEAPVLQTVMQVAAVPAQKPAMQQQSPVFVPANADSPRNFEELADLFRRKGEYLIHDSIVNEIHLVSFKPERLEIRLAASASRELPNKIGNMLNSWTGKRWVLVVSSEAGQPTLGEQKVANKLAAIENSKEDPLVKEVLKYFPDAVISDVRYTEQKINKTENI